MKLQFASSPIITSENMDSSVMGMDESGMDQACFFLRDKIYSDKILAVVREYACNALDEHVKFNIQRPVEMGIRNEDGSDFFFVRDFARGLSEHDIRNVFGKYFKSTKRNNNIQSGSFGLGAKAAHCYTDTFYVKSYHNGVCSLYACALGGGNTGVPVGHILKVSESPTEETGLEVYLEIKSNDRFKFESNCKNFVRFCSAGIVFVSNDLWILPEQPVAQVERDGFVFRFFKNRNDSYADTIYSMGNVTYYKNYFRYLNNNAHLNGTTIVIDIPIGAMTLPISRESFEDTPNNTRVFDNIKKAVGDLVKEDIDSIKPMSLQELVKDRDNHLLQGQYFSIYKKDVYSSVYPFVLGISTVGNSGDFETKKVLPLCAVIKSRKMMSYWKDKLESHANKNGKKYYLVSADSLNNCDLKAIGQFFELRDVKSSVFGWPKDANNKSNLSMDALFSVSILGSSNYYKHLHLNALQVYNHICTMVTNYPQTASTVDEARKNMSKITFDSLAKLNHFTVRKANSTSGCTTTVTRSTTLYKNLLSLGFLDADSQEYKDQYKKISAAEQERAEIARSVQNIRKAFLSREVMDSLSDRANRNIKFSKKANSVFEKIKDETSLRGKILRSLEHGVGYYYSSKPHLSRQELRTVLRLK